MAALTRAGWALAARCWTLSCGKPAAIQRTRRMAPRSRPTSRRQRWPNRHPASSGLTASLCKPMILSPGCGQCLLATSPCRKLRSRAQPSCGIVSRKSRPAFIQLRRPAVRKRRRSARESLCCTSVKATIVTVHTSSHSIPNIRIFRRDISHQRGRWRARADATKQWINSLDRDMSMRKLGHPSKNYNEAFKKTCMRFALHPCCLPES